MEYACIRLSQGVIKYNANGVNLPLAKHSRSHEEEYKFCWKGRPRAYIGINKYVLVFTLWQFMMGDIEITGDRPYIGLWHIMSKIKYWSSEQVEYINTIHINGRKHNLLMSVSHGHVYWLLNLYLKDKHNSINKYVLVFTLWQFVMGDIEITGDRPYIGLWHVMS